MRKLMRSEWLVMSVLCFFILTSTLSLSSCSGGGGGTTPNNNTGATDVSGPTKSLASKAAIISYLDSIGIYTENGTNPQGATGLVITDFGFDVVLAANQQGRTSTIADTWNAISSLVTINKSAQDFCDAINTGYHSSSTNYFVTLFHPGTADIAPGSTISAIQVAVLYAAFGQAAYNSYMTATYGKPMSSSSVKALYAGSPAIGVEIGVGVLQLFTGTLIVGGALIVAAASGATAAPASAPVIIWGCSEMAVGAATLMMTGVQLYNDTINATGNVGTVNPANYIDVSGSSSNANLSTPTGVTASDGTSATKIDISWNSGGGANSYEVYRATMATGPYSFIASTASTSYSDSVTSTSAFYYKIRAHSGSTYSAFSAYDSGYLQVVTPTLVANPAKLNFTAVAGGSNPASQNVYLSGVQTLTWTPTKTQAWLTVTTMSAGSYGVTAAINITGLAAGTYTDNVTITAPGASNSPLLIPISLTVTAAPPDTTPPSVPTGLTATAVSSSQIDLSWTASTDNVLVSTYKVFRGTTFINSVSHPTTVTSDTGLSPSTQYCYTVRAVDSSNNVSGDSVQACATTQAVVTGDTTKPTVPGYISVTAASSTQLNISWGASTDNVAVAGYRIYKGGVLLKSVTSGTSTTDTGLTPSTQYCYTVSAYDAANNESAQTSQGCATTSAAGDTQSPTMPGSLSVTAPNSTSINISWGASTDNVVVVGYRIYKAGVLLKSVTSGLSTTDTSLTPGTQYCYTVSAYDAANNESAQTSQGCATTTMITAVAGGLDHTIALKNNGMVWIWGSNYRGQLGDGTTTSRSTPVQVNGVSSVSAIASGQQHTIVLKNDGTVWDWGVNYSGQLGDGTTTDRSTPVQVSGLGNVTAIASARVGDGCGYELDHTIALKNDGTVWTWGYNYYGQLGDGTTTNRSTPVQVSGLSGVTAIAGGGNHTIALKNDGTVWTWGYNYSGQLGDGTTTDRNTPVQVAGL